MKLGIIFAAALFLLSSTATVFAGEMDKGFSSPQAAVDTFLSNLKNGRAGLSQAIDLLPGETDRQNKLIEEVKKSSEERPIESALSQAMGSDKLLSFRKTGQEVKFGGKMVKMYYDLYFAKSPTKSVTFLIMQPTMSGGYYILDVVISGKTDLKMMQNLQETN
jgi:hypothetical protein